jgi:hypothetical protein
MSLCVGARVRIMRTLAELPPAPPAAGGSRWARASGSTRFEGQRPTAANALAELRATTRLRVSHAPRFVRHSVFVYRAARALRGLARPELPRFFKVPAGLPA